jgi:hypothetical protein
VEEERKIFEYHKTLGNKWAQIANILQGRTDNMIKNQFYSTLRRQQRKINKLLVSKAFQSLVGGKTTEIKDDELYKHIKDEKVDYDDIKLIYGVAVAQADLKKVEKFKKEAIKEVKAEKVVEARHSLSNRRSYRLSKKQKSDEEDYDFNKVAFLLLFKILRDFREVNKDNLPDLSGQDSLDTPLGSHSFSDFTKQANSKNKRKIKLEAKEDQKLSENQDKSSMGFKKTVSPDDNLLYQASQNEEESFTVFKGLKSASNPPSAQKSINGLSKKSEKSVREFSLQESGLNKEFSHSKSSEENKQPKAKIDPEDNDPKIDINNYLQVNNSPHKNFHFGDKERDHSLNSNMSQSFAYHNEEFNPFSHKQQNMNLSRPQEVNFDSLSINPSASLVKNMMRCNELSKPLNKQVSFTLNFLESDSAKSSSS